MAERGASGEEAVSTVVVAVEAEAGNPCDVEGLLLTVGAEAVEDEDMVTSFSPRAIGAEEISSSFFIRVSGDVSGIIIIIIPPSDPCINSSSNDMGIPSGNASKLLAVSAVTTVIGSGREADSVG